MKKGSPCCPFVRPPAAGRLASSADGGRRPMALAAAAAMPLPAWPAAAHRWAGSAVSAAPGGGPAELLAELLDPAGLDDALLCAGVERMRIRRDVELEQRVLVAVVHLDRLAGIGGRPGDELEAAGHVLEHDLAILGGDAFFHGSRDDQGLAAAGNPKL